MIIVLPAAAQAMVDAVTVTVSVGLYIANKMYSKGGKQNVRDSGLSDLSTDAIKGRLKDPFINKKEKKRLEKELKARGERNKQKRCN